MIRSVKCTDENDVVNKSDNMLQAIETGTVHILKEVQHRMNKEGSRIDDLMEIHRKMLL
ncbi:hypothetical protein DPMN_038429 [Dreissena polymorpha]|uniref:Uncharacterized protein n=1 Tax=Dreissena polymorpha TaxID=45954 RepID=A0A9D4MF89_DREPO|nr:hypothetical protein DPMN_038429 [Dreissena polymorpha]